MANHISNGVFETNSATGAGQTPDGWTATSSTPDLQTDGGYEWAGSYMPGDLDAASGSGYVTMFTNATKVEALSTTLNTSILAGETYTFEFDFYVNESDGTTNQGGATNLIVTIGSQTITIPIDSTGASAPYWQTQSVTFTATDTSNSFTISNEIDPGALGFTGVALDNLNLDIQPDYIVSGTSGNDTIDAFYLDDVQGDRIDALDHSDNSNADSVLAGAGDDIIRSGAGNDTVFGQDGSDTIEGGAGDDTLDGDDGDSGGAGDVISGEAGTDQIIGDVGNDTLDGGIGNDTIYAGADDDSVMGGDGEDQIFGQDGNDSIAAGVGNDQVYGGDGNDTVLGGDGNDSVSGGAGDDLIDDEFGPGTNGAGEDSFDGGTGNDTLFAGVGNDTVIGGDGDDYLGGEEGDDLIEGGADADTIELWGPFDADTIDGGEAVTTGVDFDQIDASLTGEGVTLNVTGDEAGTISDSAGTAQFTNIEGFTLTDYDDTVDASGDSTGLTINTGDGADQIAGGSGNDTIDVGAADGDVDTVVLTDGSGQDIVSSFEGPIDNGDGTYTGQDQLDVSTLTSDGGTTPATTANVTVTNDGSGNAILTFPGGESVTLIGVGPWELTTPESLEAIGIPLVPQNYIVEGTDAGELINAGYGGDPEGDRVDANDNLTNDNDDSIRAFGGDDIIGAGAGNDSVDAGTGDDQVFAETGNDTVLGGDGNDSVLGETGDDNLLGEAGNDTLLGGDGHDVIDGGADNDSLRGEDGNDTLDGGIGDDYLHGGAGNDSIDGGAGNDEMHGWYGNDTMSGNEGDDYLDADLGEDLVMGGAGNDTIKGGFSTESDTLLGGSGNDDIDGQAGDDRIEGGVGHDTMFGSDGDDTFIIEDNFGSDSITGGETDEFSGGDTLDLSATTTGIRVDLTNADPEAGTFTDGTDTASFTEIENIILGGGDDTIALADGGGDDTVQAFEGPIDNGDGTYTGQDQLDVSALTDAGGDPVSVQDVTVTDDGSGNAVLSFPNGESLTLIGVPPGDVTDYAALEAIGIPNGLDYVVQGTSGNDTIDAGYLGDPDGDRVDANDNAENDNDDSIDAGAGNDVILAGLGNDTVRADEGDDSVLGGDGNDEIYGFEGRDTVDGGAGDDLINTRTSPGTGLPDQGYADPGNPGISYPGDTDPNNDRDSVLGGTGDDTILTGDDNDTIDGGSGNDSIDAGFDDDSVIGGLGNDTIEAGEGNDTVDGGDGDDVIYGGLSPSNPASGPASLYEQPNDGSDAAPANNADELSGGDGNDSIYGQDDNDVLSGDDGDDLLDGGIDDDTLTGGAGNDSLIGGDGNDDLYGDSGADTIEAGDGDDLIDGGIGGDSINAGAGNDILAIGQDDTVTGGDGDDTFLLTDTGEAGAGMINIVGGEGDETDGDTLQLTSDISRDDITFTNTDDAAGGLAGNFTMSDGTLVTFDQIENIICFTPGARILTNCGERAIEKLKLGDLVVTRDHGLRPIRWIGKRTVAGRGAFAPISIAPGVAKANTKGLLVSPQHRILFTGYRAELLFGEDEVLVPAKHLIDGRDVQVMEQDEVTYIHIMFDRHEVIYADGIASESFHAGDVGLSAIEEAAREELFAIFPELRTAGSKHRMTARTCLKKREAELLQAYMREDSWDF